jgi:hypothetical protein
MTGLFIVFLIFIALCGAAAYSGQRVARANGRDGVFATWEGLRVNKTELIEGYKADARRHPLKGLAARVEDAGTRAGGRDDRRVHVIIEGPDTNIVKSAKASSPRNGDAAARQFVATVNATSRELEL